MIRFGDFLAVIMLEGIVIDLLIWAMGWWEFTLQGSTNKPLIMINRKISNSQIFQITQRKFIQIHAEKDFHEKINSSQGGSTWFSNVFDYLNDKVNIFLLWHQRDEGGKNCNSTSSLQNRDEISIREKKKYCAFEVRRGVEWKEWEMFELKLCLCMTGERGGNLICRVACFSERDKNGKVSSKIFVILQSN